MRRKAVSYYRRLSEERRWDCKRAFGQRRNRYAEYLGIPNIPLVIRPLKTILRFPTLLIAP